jgi:exodeoxyribonuclease V gamma subunit
VGFHLYRSNRVERLAGALREVVREPLASPFARECIVVQGPGMERWLSAQLARGLGVWANPWFPFPRTIVELLLDTVLGPLPDETRWYAPEALTFRIARVLPELLAQPAFDSLARYLKGDRGHERLLAVSTELGQAFDQCMVYRPEQLLGWESGQGQEREAVLWRQLVAEAPTPHLAGRLRAFHAAIDGGARVGAVAERISLFGLSALPPAFLAVLARASSQLDVHLFTLTPTGEYWGDFDASMARGEDLHALLATLGKVGRDLGEQLTELGGLDSEHDLFDVPAHDTLLAGLQADLCTLTARGDHGAARRSAHASDTSLSVHVCHSELREMEVLQGQLRARLEADPSLEPHDIVVLTPDIERYAACVHAVFAPGGDDDVSAIPYHVADRQSSRLSQVSDALLALLELTRSRLGLSEVLDLLHRRPVRQRFELEEDDLARAEAWLTEAGARWAIDAAHRQSFEQPAVHENTLAFALDRLLLGYAAIDGERRSYAGSLPFSDAEGNDALPLGKLARFLRTLFDTVRDLGLERPATAWAERIGSALAALFSADDELAAEHLALRAALSEIAGHAVSAGLAEPLSLLAFQRELVARLDRRRAGAGFLSGGVSFCEHVPMRAIPFRLVCLVGMDDESFPRRARRSAFDLLGDTRRKGDRTLRDDDRQIFLESLLSARDALWISYVGRSAKDDSARPASVLVDQLLALLDRHFVPASDGANLRLDFEGSVAQSITHVHALHRFDPRYFRDPRHPVFFSYDRAACAAARVLAAPAPEPQPFVVGPLPPRELEARELSLEALVRFFRAPPRAFLEERLGVVLPRDRSEVPDREPTALAGLDRYRVGDDLLRDMFSWPSEERHRILRQEGRLPPGALGELAFQGIERDVAAVQQVAGVSEPEQERFVRVELPMLAALAGEPGPATLRLSGRIDGIVEPRRVERTIAQARGKHLLGAWIRHLALCASGDAAWESALASRGKRGAELACFHHVRDARERLAELAGLRLLGLSMPLPFFAASALACARALAKGKSEAEARVTLDREANRGSTLLPAEVEDRSAEQLWSPRELERPSALTARGAGGRMLDGFALACLVMVPLVSHLRGDVEP